MTSALTPRLLVIGCSVREGRAGPSVVRWTVAQAAKHAGFAVGSVDLRDVVTDEDEPELPSTGRYVHEHTRRWSQTVAAADAVFLVTPEYNHSFTGKTKLALDRLYLEWANKPVGFLSYGGQSGGLRAVEALKPVLCALRMHPLSNGVAVPNFQDHLATGHFQPTDGVASALHRHLDELLGLTQSLLPLRA